MTLKFQGLIKTFTNDNPFQGKPNPYFQLLINAK